MIFAATFVRQGLHHSLVLIDGREHHIDEGRHLAFFEAIVALGAESQLIAATSSRAILEGARAHVIRLSRGR